MNSSASNAENTSDQTADNNQPGIMFTAFEPSGDEHAAPAIAYIKKHRPEIPIWGTGGDLMINAGAELMEHTTAKATMGLGALQEVRTHLKRLKRMKAYIKQRKVAVVVPVDSPAANWSVCSLHHKVHPGVKVVHMVCPQIWAWASWRIKKLRRLTDFVLCLLPFEPDWLKQRGVEALYIGHPAMDEIPESPNSAEQVKRIALLPGSRKKEMERNWPTMAAVMAKLMEKYPDLTFEVGAFDDRANQIVTNYNKAEMAGSIDPNRFSIKIGQTPEVIQNADAVLAVSGTVTLHVAKAGKPMVNIYNSSKLSWLLIGKLIIATRTFTLPNLISEWLGIGRVAQEFCPHFGEVAPVYEAMEKLVSDKAHYAKQKQGIKKVIEALGDDHDWGKESGEKILEFYDKRVSEMKNA